jgi:hypothetical protein
MKTFVRIWGNALLCRPIRGDLPRGWARLPDDLCEQLAVHFPGLDPRHDVAWRISGIPRFIRMVALIRPVGITFGTLVCLHPDYYQPDTADGLELIAHELTHVEQYRAVGYPIFTLRYGFEFLRNLLRGNSIHDAYENISFEVEARERAARVVDEWEW